MPVLSTIYWIFFAVVWVMIAFWPARVASRKGRSFFLFFVCSLFFWPLTLIVALLMKDNRQAPPTVPAE
jgi:hypothetical protein